MSEHLVVAIDDLTLHPDAGSVPEPDAGDMAALSDSLAEHGQQDPIDVTPDLVILDGRTRWRLLRRQGHLTILARVVDVPESQRRAYIVERALSRRHLSVEQRKALAAVVLRDQPERSDRSVARETGVSHPTVAAIREGLEESGDVEELSTRADAAGRWQPAHKPRPEVLPPAGRDPSAMTPPPDVQRRIARTHLMERLAMARSDADMCDGRLTQDDLDAIAGHLDYIRWRLFHVGEGRATLREVTHVS